MDESTARSFIAGEVSKATTFTNSHGITSKNIFDLQVDPHPILVDLDDGSKELKQMWRVLKQPDGCPYEIAYDGIDKNWAVVERTGERYLCVVVADSLAKALDGM
jgi:hypothetical protein